MATESETSHDPKNEELLTISLNEIIEKNLTIGISKLDSADDHDFNDDHIDIKSNASSHRRRSSISYSQPTTPKAHPSSLSPLSSVSSISDLSNEYPDDNDSESCASLNSVNSSYSTQSNDSFGAIYHELITKEVILEDRESIDSHPSHTPNHKPSKKLKKPKHLNALTKSNSHESTLKPSSKRKKSKSKKATTSSKRKSKTRPRRNSKDCLDITGLSRLTTKSIQLWSVSEVVEWIKLIDKGKYKEYANKFQTKKVDGKKLYKMNYAMLQSLEIYHPSARKAILAALQKLKTKIRQNSKKQINFYAKSHGYDPKKRHTKKAHRRGISSPHTPHFKPLQDEMYVIAIKRQNSDRHGKNLQNNQKTAVMPGLETSISAPNVRKESCDISEFLDEWEIPYTNESNINFLNSTILQQTNNFTMIELSNKKIVYAVTAKVEKWNNDDVCKWLNAIANGRFKRFASKFKERKTTGFDLLNISRVQLQNNIGMLDPQMRSTLLREIKLLKIATKPSSNMKSKKRSSAVSIKEIQAATSLKAAKSSPGKHRKTKSVNAGMLDMYGKYSKSVNALEDIVPRKLGPRDIGRVHGFKGTKWEKSLFNYEFLEEKINYHAKSSYFEERKRANPVQHKQTVNEIGISTNFQPINDCNDILRKMRGGPLFADKPISRKNPYLDSLKGQSVPKGIHVSDIIGPVGWEPINYKYEADGKEFLHEHFWFDGSGVPFNFSFSRLLNCLSPQKRLKLNKQPAPTGYESKLNWLKMLLNMVTEEMEVIKKEDALYAQEEDVINDEQKEDEVVIQDIIAEEQEVCPILGKPPTIDIDIINEEKEVEIVKCDDDEDDDGVQNGEEAKTTSSESGGVDHDTQNVTESGGNSSSSSAASGTDDDGEYVVSSPGSNVSSPSSAAKRKSYKRSRSGRVRANTTLANSTLGGVASKSMTPRRMKRTMSRQDMNRRRFMSQESVDSIQAIIQNIEKQRSSRNVEKVMD